MTALRPNRVTPEGWLLGNELGRLCDAAAAAKGKDGRCETCAFRAGDHLANGSPETLMSAVKCVAEREPFWCHERDRPCAGWQLMKAPADSVVVMPWGHHPGSDDPDEPTGCADDALPGTADEWRAGLSGKAA